MIRMVSIVHVDSGLTLFTKVFEDFCKELGNQVVSELVGSFLTAIKCFSQQFGQDKIQQIEMNTIKFLIYEREKMMIFFVLDDDDKVESYKKSLTMSLKAFLGMFSKSIETNYNEIEQFSNFNSVLHEILKISPDEIEYSCLECPMGQKKDCLFKKVKEEILLFKSNYQS